MLLESSQKNCKKNLHFSCTGCNIRYTVSLVCIDNLRRFIPPEPFRFTPRNGSEQKGRAHPPALFYFFFWRKKENKKSFSLFIFLFYLALLFGRKK